MQNSDITSIAALVISLASPAIALYFNLRDRARIITKSDCYLENYGQGASLSVSIVNAGRRPIVLRMWAGTDGGEHWSGTHIKSAEGGLRLGEHERFDLRLSLDDLEAVVPGEDFIYADLWFEDTLGRRYPVVGAKENIKKLRGEIC